MVILFYGYNNMIYVIIILLLFVLYFVNNRTEPYNNLGYYPTRLFWSHKYGKMDKCNSKTISSVDIKPIEPGINETKCIVTLCPEYFSDNITCYYCV